MKESELDMRMDKSTKFSAKDVVNNYEEEKLANIIYEYGEEKFSRRIAKNICEFRKSKDIETTSELVEIIEKSVPKNKNSGHPAKRTFQAIRIEVNNEIKPLYNTISYAIEGIISTMKEERNMTIHILMMFLVITAGIIFHISYLEWIICLILCGLILTLELINTAIENVVDLVTVENNKKAKIAKDSAAGAVLIMSIFASIIGLIIFLPKIFIS